MASGLTKSEWARICEAFDELVGLEPSARAARLKTLKLPDRLTSEFTSLLAASEGDGPLDARASGPPGIDGLLNTAGRPLRRSRT